MKSPATTHLVVNLIGGSLLTVLGLFLIFNSAASISLMVGLLCVGLVLVGIVLLSEPGADSQRRAVHTVSAVLLIMAGLALLVCRFLSLPVLALIVSIVLFCGGALRLFGVFPRGSKPRIRGLLTAATGLFASVLVLFWPRMSLWVLGVAFGAWLALQGLRALAGTFSAKLPAAPVWWRKSAQGVLTALTAVGLVLILGAGAITAWIHSTGERTVADEFYLPPASVPELPGQLIRAEPLEHAAIENTRAWRILYTTTLEDGAAAVASGVVTVPASDDDTERPVLSWANGTKGVVPRRAPSLSANPYEDGPNMAREELLASGWAVVATDYVGLGTRGPHPYLVGNSEAHAVLDATRAAAELDAAQLSSRTVLWGHSQGGHAALFSALAAQEYAPELDVLGTAALAPATDLSTLATGIKDDAAGKIVTSYIASAWDEIYPDLALTSMLDASARSAVSRISDLCFTGKDVLAAMATSSQLFAPVINGSALNGPIGDQLMANSVPFKVPGPVFVAQGSSDTLVLPSMQRGWTAQACAAGSDLLYREYDGLDHLNLVGRGSALNADLVNWTKSLLTAEQASANCADDLS